MVRGEESLRLGLVNAAYLAVAGEDAVEDFQMGEEAAAGHFGLRSPPVLRDDERIAIGGSDEPFCPLAMQHRLFE